MDKVDASYSSITALFEDMSEFLGRLGVYQKQRGSEELNRIFVEILSQMLVIFGLATKKINVFRTGMIDYIHNCRLMLM